MHDVPIPQTLASMLNHDSKKNAIDVAKIEMIEGSGQIKNQR